MTVTRQPTGQDLICLVCHKGDNIDIDHVVNRGMGGSKKRDVPENKVPLCRDCHRLKTDGRIETWVDMDGEELARRVNGTDSIADTPLILASTASVGAETMARLKEAGFADRLTKPLRQSELLNNLAKHCLG